MNSFDKTYNRIKRNLISEQYFGKRRAADPDTTEDWKAERDEARFEREREDLYGNRPSKSQLRKEYFDSIKKERQSFAEAAKAFKEMPTDSLKKEVLAFTDNLNDHVIRGKAVDELLKRPDVDIKFFEDILFDTKLQEAGHSFAVATIKKAILEDDPQARVKNKILNHEYPLEKLKSIIEYMEKNEHFHKFDSNFSHLRWCELLVAFMRRGGYFTGTWPDEKYADK